MLRLNKKDVQDDHSGILGMGILFLLVLPIYSLVLSFILNIFKIQANFHWLPLIINAICFFAVGAFLGVSYDYFKERHFLICHKYKNTGWEEEYSFFLKPYGKTVSEINVALNTKYKENGYRKNHRIRIVVFWALGLVILLIAYFINPVLISSLVTYPVTLLSALAFSSSISAEDYLDKATFPEWKEYLCPNCGAICSRFGAQISDKKEKSSIYTYTTKVTDKITDGYNSANIEREQQRLGVKNTSSWKETYCCERCKTSFSKDNSYTSGGRKPWDN